MSGPSLSDCVTVHVPMTFRQHGGRKQVIAPNGESWAPPRARIDNTMVKALARAFRCRRMLESGAVATIKDIAATEGVTDAFVSRFPRLAYLSPDVLERLLIHRRPCALPLDRLAGTALAPWAESGGAVFDGRDDPSRSLQASPTLIGNRRPRLLTLASRGADYR
jgi:hypothetical protein